MGDGIIKMGMRKFNIGVCVHNNSDVVFVKL